MKTVKPKVLMLATLTIACLLCVWGSEWKMYAQDVAGAKSTSTPQTPGLDLSVPAPPSPRAATRGASSPCPRQWEYAWEYNTTWDNLQRHGRAGWEVVSVQPVTVGGQVRYVYLYKRGID